MDLYPLDRLACPIDIPIYLETGFHIFPDRLQGKRLGIRGELHVEIEGDVATQLQKIRSHYHKVLKQMMMQARLRKASYIMASLSQRTTNLLKLPSQANILSTRLLYSSAHLRRPLGVLRRGMQGIAPLLRSQPRKRSQSYALSATSLSGLFLGRPLLHGTRTRSKVS